MLKRNDFFNKEIIPIWEEIEKNIKYINVKGLSTIDRDEIAHLKKVIAYLSTMFNSIDADFIPIKVLNNLLKNLKSIHTLLNHYMQSENIGYIKSINEDYLDTLLQDIMPFIFYKGSSNMAKTLRGALDEYSETISEHSQGYMNNIEKSVNRANELQKEIEDISQNLEILNKKFIELDKDIFLSEDNLKDEIHNLVSDLKKKYHEIQNYYDIVFSKENGFKLILDNYISEAEKGKNSIIELKNNSENMQNELSDFHAQIFGLEGYTSLENEINEQKSKLNQIHDNKETELNQLIDKKEKELDDLKLTKEQMFDDFADKQENIFQTLTDKIESLLPSATSAGLSSAYYNMRRRFSRDILIYNILFGCSIVVWLFIVFNIKDLDITTTNMGIQLDANLQKNIGVALQAGSQTESHLISLLKWFLVRLPFIIPILWFTIFVSKRRAEAQRLEQEYAHKEALAKSYESYKRQIETLDVEEQNKLLPVLLNNMIEAMALNPANTLSKSNKNEMPLDDLLNKKDELLDFLKKIQELLPNRDNKNTD